MTAAGYKIWWKKSVSPLLSLCARPDETPWYRYLTTLQITQFVIDLFTVYFASYSYFAWTYARGSLPTLGSCAGTEGAAIFGCALLSESFPPPRRRPFSPFLSVFSTSKADARGAGENSQLPLPLYRILPTHVQEGRPEQGRRCKGRRCDRRQEDQLNPHLLLLSRLIDFLRPSRFSIRTRLDHWAPRLLSPRTPPFFEPFLACLNSHPSLSPTRPSTLRSSYSTTTLETSARDTPSFRLSPLPSPPHPFPPSSLSNLPRLRNWTPFSRSFTPRLVLLAPDFLLQNKRDLFTSIWLELARDALPLEFECIGTLQTFVVLRGRCESASREGEMRFVASFHSLLPRLASSIPLFVPRILYLHHLPPLPSLPRPPLPLPLSIPHDFHLPKHLHPLPLPEP